MAARPRMLLRTAGGPRQPGVDPSIRTAAIGAAAIAAIVAGAAATVLLAYRTEPFVPLIAAAGVAVGALALARPMLTLYLGVALIPLETMAVSIGDIGISPAEAMFAVTGAGWAAGRLLRGRVPLTPTPLNAPLALLILAVVPGIAVAAEVTPVVKTLVMWTTFFLVLQMIVAEADAKAIQRLLLMLALAGGVVGLIAVVKSGAEAPELVGVGQDAVGRAVSSFEDPNILAAFSAIAVPAAMALALTGPRSVRPLAFAAFGLSLAGVALSLSRAGLLAIVGALLVLLAWRPFRRAVVIAVAVIVPLALSSANPLGDIQQVQTVEGRLSSIGYSAQGVDPRFDLWERTPELIIDSMPFGVGAVNFAEVAPSYGLSLLQGATTYAHAHNVPLTVLAELGIVGFLAMVWLAVAVGRLALASVRRTRGAARGMTWAVVAALVAIALQGMVDYTLRSNVIAGLLFALVGALVVLSRAAERGDDPAADPGQASLPAARP